VKTKTLEIEGVSVLFKRSERARRISISVTPLCEVRVNVPGSSSFEKAEQFLLSKMGWVRKQIAKIKNYESEQELLRFSYEEEAAAKIKLVNRLANLAEKHGFTYNRVTIRSQKTRWGSCSAKNNISLNIKLAKLPDELMEYVILHELVHTRVKNHSPLFWQELDKFVPNAKQMRKRLKQYSGALYF